MPAADIPSREKVAELLRQEPIARASWPAWRPRLLAWVADREHRTDSADEAACSFLRDQVQPNGELPPPLAGDALAWYYLGCGNWCRQLVSDHFLSVGAGRNHKPTPIAMGRPPMPAP